MRLNDLLPISESYLVFKAGQTLFKEGDPGDFMFVLYEGMVEVRVQQKVIGVFEPIEIFGEMAAIDPQPRSATIVAQTDCRVARINQGRFLMLIQKKPEFALHIMQMLVERMRWMDSVAQNTSSEHAQEIEKLQAAVGERKAVLNDQRQEIASLEQQLKHPDRTVLAFS